MPEQKTCPQRLKQIKLWVAAGLGLLMTMMLWRLVSASEPPQGGRRVGLVSTTIDYLVVEAGKLNSVSDTVRLAWEGQIDEAFLVLSAAGSQGRHSIYVNDRFVASAPVQPAGELCQTETLIEIPISPEALVNGENVIKLTNDADANDGWTAADVHIEIHGVLSGPPVTSLETPLTGPPPVGMKAMTTISGTVSLTSTYELAQGRVITQVVWYQIPMSYTEGISVPLVIALHGMGGTGEWIRDYLAEEANNRGWLLAAPDMHGRYYINHGRYALGWVGAQHDVIDAVEYMTSNYTVDTSRIYVVGGSMGGQATAMMSAKYPDLFAAVVPWKPITDLTDWYYEVEALDDPYHDLRHVRRETGGTSAGTTPSEAPFEYQRRSPIEIPQNSRLMPIKMWHEVDDGYVYIHHSRDLRDAINNKWAPPIPVVLIEVPADANDCPPDDQGRDLEHCYNPPPAEVFDFLDNFTLNTAPPLYLSIRTDESKPYYWLNCDQTGDDHWSEVEASYSLTETTVRSTISDTQPLTVAFNLGSTPLTGPGGISRPGMGLPMTTYLVHGGGNYKLETYTSGYLTVPLTTTGRFSLTISAITADLSAYPDMVSGWQTTTSTITAVIQDHLNNPAPDGTMIEFFTTEGTFPNGSSTYTTTVIEGQVTTTLTLKPSEPDVDLANIIASVEAVTSSTSVDIIHPALDVMVTPNQPIVYSEQVITYTYTITNTGDITLTAVTLVDDNGTPGDNDDDLVICTDITLPTAAATSCSRNTTLTQTTTNTASVTGRDPLENYITSNSTATVNVISPAIEVSTAPDKRLVHSGEAVTFTYQITNTGDTTLTDVQVVDYSTTTRGEENGLTTCADITLAAGSTTNCSRSTTLTWTTFITTTATGQDPLGNWVLGNDTTTVEVQTWNIYLPVVLRGHP